MPKQGEVGAGSVKQVNIRQANLSETIHSYIPYIFYYQIYHLHPEELTSSFLLARTENQLISETAHDLGSFQELNHLPCAAAAVRN